MFRKLYSRRRDEKGAIMALAAGSMVVFMISAAFAVDLGRLSQEKRNDQKIADLAALDAARELPVPGNVKNAATASANRNGFSVTPANTVYGVGGPNPNMLYVCIGSMVSGEFMDTSGACNSGDAVRVRVQSAFSTAFPFLAGHDVVSATGAAQLGLVPEAAFAVGSTLASLDTQASALDGVLGPMLGETAAGMSVVSYNGLASGNVTLAALRTKLMSMGYTFASPSDVLTSNIQVAQLLTATSQVLADQGNTTAKAEVDKIINLGIASSLMVQLGRLVSVDSPATGSALDTNVNVFRLVSGAAQVANGTNFVAVPGVDVSIPLVASVTTSLRVVEPAQTARGKVGVEARTAQVVLRLRVALLASGVTLNLDYSAAGARARLSDISCDTSPPSIDLTPTTTGMNLNVSSAIVGTTINGTSTVAAGASPSTATFDYTDEFMPPVGNDFYAEHVGATTLNFTPVSPLQLTSSNGLTQLLLDTTVEGLLNNTVLPVINSTLVPLLQPVLRSLGVDVAGADLMAQDIIPAPPACDGVPGEPVLVK